MPIKVFIVNDQNILKNGLMQLPKNQLDIIVVGETDDDPTNDDDNDLAVTDEPIEVNKNTALVEDYEAKYLIKQDITIPGTYYCVITNHVNGSFASKKTNKFRVSPI